MKVIRYGKYVGEPADAVDLEELVRRLGDFFLQSGFESQYYGVSEMDPEKSMEALREAILRALQEGDLLPENAMSDELRQMLQNPDARNSQEVQELLDKLMERLAQEDDRFSGLQDATGSTRFTGAQQFWTSRYERSGNWRGIGRQFAAVRVWRYAQSGHQRNALQRCPPRRRQGSH
jgi:ElaB/YqjD/DUF883 family membrane-anchored ribosome-binding protein